MIRPGGNRRDVTQALRHGSIAPCNHLTVCAKSNSMSRSIPKIDDSGKPWRHHRVAPTDHGTIRFDRETRKLTCADGDDVIKAGWRCRRPGKVVAPCHHGAVTFQREDMVVAGCDFDHAS